MVRRTQHHQYQVPEGSDPNYPEVFNSFIDELDVDVLLRGTIGNRPTPGVTGRWYLSTDENPPTIYFDTGDQWVSPAMYGDPPETLAHRNRNETITGQYTFEQPVHADITGSAKTADEAGEAQSAQNAQRIGGHTADEFARTDKDETFSGGVQFTEQVDAAGVNCTQGTIRLARYSGSDPTSQAGDMWMRQDRQP